MTLVALRVKYSDSSLGATFHHKYQLFSWQNKRDHDVIIYTVIASQAEAWTMTKKEEQAVLIFERKIFRRMYMVLNMKMENGKVGRNEN